LLEQNNNEIKIIGISPTLFQFFQYYLQLLKTTNHSSPSDGDMLFFDANIWLAIYGPSPKHWAQSPCSSLFYELIKNNIDIYTNSLIISEVVNSWARLEF
jgi:hypothetical protein